MRVFRVICPNGTVAEDDIHWVRAAVDRARYWDTTHVHEVTAHGIPVIHRVQVADWVTLP
jgi:hypothetical protein